MNDIRDVMSIKVVEEKELDVTYKHVISPFVSGRITVEVFCKAWLHMCSFVL